VFGNKLAILGGDFLLSRASISLARLRNVEVVELMSTIIEHLVKGEVMQMKAPSSGPLELHSTLEYYLRKNFYKTASLMGHSCLSTAVLGTYAHTSWHL
jgi:geranylgeranyl pyrophosphate synthase